MFGYSESKGAEGEDVSKDVLCTVYFADHSQVRERAEMRARPEIGHVFPHHNPRTERLPAAEVTLEPARLRQVEGCWPEPV